MFRFPLFRRSRQSLHRIRRQTATEISELQMDRLNLALSASGYQGVRKLYGNTVAYDYNGQRDNSLYAATLIFESAETGDRFLTEIAGILRHLRGPGTADFTVTRTEPGMRVGFNPLLAGALARRLETASRDESAVGKEDA